MILPALVLAATFAPPSAAVRYTIRDLYSEHPYQAVTTIQRLAFTRDAQGIVAHLITVARTIDAQGPAKDALARLFGPLTGIESKLRLDATGRSSALIDSDRPWAAFLASRAALRAKIDADPNLPPATKAAAHKVLDAETAPDARDERLREPFLQLLPPRLPALAPGANSDFSAVIATAGGALPATGKVTLVAGDGALLRYRIAMTTAPIATSKAYYSETNDLVIERTTGLLFSAHRVRNLVFADGHSQPLLTEDIAHGP